MMVCMGHGPQRISILQNLVHTFVLTAVRKSVKSMTMLCTIYIGAIIVATIGPGVPALAIAHAVQQHTDKDF
jgi:hypothetical protein